MKAKENYQEEWITVSLFKQQSEESDEVYF